MNSDAIVETVLGFYPDVEAVYLFGTYQTEGEWPDSDVDIALLFSHNRAKEIKNIALSDGKASRLSQKGPPPLPLS
ncbi:MAG: nucleotidyltransferase domain-containing protein [Deltaproteobacteria bacterium]